VCSGKIVDLRNSQHVRGLVGAPSRGRRQPSQRRFSGLTEANIDARDYISNVHRVERVGQQLCGVAWCTSTRRCTATASKALSRQRVQTQGSTHLTSQPPCGVPGPQRRRHGCTGRGSFDACCVCVVVQGACECRRLVFGKHTYVHVFRLEGWDGLLHECVSRC
jgi:hypothetical protein